VGLHILGIRFYGKSPREEIKERETGVQHLVVVGKGGKKSENHLQKTLKGKTNISFGLKNRNRRKHSAVVKRENNPPG